MRYLIIGLGIYGSNLARDLVAMGHEVIGADMSRATVDTIKDYITTAYVIDSTEESALTVLPLRNVDVVIVAIGENFGASVKTVALLKKAGVNNIYARAIDTLHESILESFKVSRIIRPEQRAASDLVHEMSMGTECTTLSVTADARVIRTSAPKFFVGLSYADLHLEQDFDVRLIAASQAVDKVNILGISHVGQSLVDVSSSHEIVRDTDVWVIFATDKALKAFYRHINR